jgi:hypothetical protein
MHLRLRLWLRLKETDAAKAPALAPGKKTDAAQALALAPTLTHSISKFFFNEQTLNLLLKDLDGF